MYHRNTTKIMTHASKYKMFSVILTLHALPKDVRCKQMATMEERMKTYKSLSVLFY